MPIQKRHNLNQTDRTVTVCRFIGWKPDTSRRIYDASRQQAAAHNRAVEHLLDQPETPLRKSSKQGAAGLQGLWLDWRAEGSGLDEILQAIWRPGVALAKTRVDAWEGKNAEDAAAVLQAGTADENNKKASRTGKRRIDPKSRGCPAGSRKSAATDTHYPAFCNSARTPSSSSRCAFSIQRCS